MTKYVGKHRTPPKWTSRKTLATLTATAGILTIPSAPAWADPPEIPSVIGMAPTIPLELPHWKAAPKVKKVKVVKKTIVKEAAVVEPPVSPRTSELPTPDPAPVGGTLGAQALAVAMQYLGWPYMGDGATWGGTSPADGGFDCSGLVQWAYSQVGVSLPRTSGAQAGVGWEVSYDNMQPGDIVVVSGGGHVGLYAGNGQMINAPEPGENIKLSPVSWFPIYAIRRVG